MHYLDKVAKMRRALEHERGLLNAGGGTASADAITELLDTARDGTLERLYDFIMAD